MIIGYTLFIVVGLLIGLLGSGGGIVTVPILIKVLHIFPRDAVLYSLVVICVTSIISLIIGYKTRKINLSYGLLILIPSSVVIFIMGKFIIPLIPDHFSVVGYGFSFNVLTVVVLSCLMLISGTLMLLNNKKSNFNTDDHLTSKTYSTSTIMLLAVIVGLVTVFLGSSAGFLLFPLLIALRLPMQEVLGTSLFIIIINSFSGIVGNYNDVVNNLEIHKIIMIIIFTILGIIISLFISKHISAYYLKKIFGVIVLSLAIFLFVSELLPLLSIA